MPVEVLVPPLGTTVDTLTLVEWYHQEGDWVEKDEALFAVQTDKSTLDVEAPASGFLRRVTAQPGDAVTSLTRIAYLTAPDEALPEDVQVLGGAGSASNDEGTARPEPLNTRTPNYPHPHTPTPPYGPDKQRTTSDRVLVSPRARRLAECHGLEWRTLAGTGPDGAIVERDVRFALSRRGDG